ncbi:MAG TPA: hypothetical protein VK081_03620 [Planctomycetota bacterium]|nr:hypothetical protein [Planctomycetota bacterium]
MPFLPAYDYRPINRWDSFRLDEFRTYVRLFGNANIGLVDHCNLQVPGQLQADETVLIEHVYARTDAAPRGAHELLHYWASHAQASVHLNDKLLRTWPLADLLQERPWEPSAIEQERAEAVGPAEVAAYEARLARREQDGPRRWRVPVRSNLSVYVQAAFHPSPDLDPKTRIWIHLEGHRLTLRPR